MPSVAPSRNFSRRGRATTTRGLAVSAAAFGLALLTWMAPVSHAQAAEIRLRSRTVGEGYMVRIPGRRDLLYTRRRLAQYVNLGVYDLLPPKDARRFHRDPKEGQLEIVTSMRLRHDFGTFQRGGLNPSATLIDTTDGRQIDLLYGYLQGRNIARWVDFRVGRQFEMSGLDWFAFDGGWLRVRTPAHLAIEAFGGFEVKGTHRFGGPDFELDGDAGTPANRAVSPMLGAAVALAGFSTVSARLAYRRVFTPAALARDIALDDGDRGLSSGVDQEIVSASISMRLADGQLNPFLSARYNLGTVQLDDVAVGAHWALTDMHALRVQYLRIRPSFDLDSIFNVFALQAFNDVRASYSVRPDRRWTIEARGRLRLFEQQSTSRSEEPPLENTAKGYGGGAALSFQDPRFSFRLDGYGLGGEGGGRGGANLDTRTALFWGRLNLDGRVFYMQYADDLNDARRGYSVALQLGINAPLWKGVQLDLVGEELLTPFHRHAFRTLMVLTLDWSMRGGSR